MVKTAPTEFGEQFCRSGHILEADKGANEDNNECGWEVEMNLDH